MSMSVPSAPPPPDNSGFEEVATRTRAAPSTVSIAVPSSILSNAQSPELRMYLAGQVARAAAIYRVDEVIVFTEHASAHNPRSTAKPPDLTRFLSAVLSYLDTPQYLRKHLFPMSADLRLVGLLNPLALPSHVPRSEHPAMRQGVFVSPRGDADRRSTRYVDVGLDRLVEVNVAVPPRTRCIVDLSLSGAGPDYDRAHGKYLFGTISASAPSAAPASNPGNVPGAGYQGFAVRSASCLSKVFSGSAVAPKGYDLTVGTSEKGTPISNSGRPSLSFALPEFSHLLVIFGGVHGLERSVIGDDALADLGIITSEEAAAAHPDDEGKVAVGSNVGDLFDFYLNTCPQQGSRTIRTEEAILLSLAALQPFIHATEMG